MTIRDIRCLADLRWTKNPLWRYFFYITWRPLKSLLYLRVIYVSSYPNEFTYMDNNIWIDFNRILYVITNNASLTWKSHNFILIHSIVFLAHMTLNRSYEGLDDGLSYLTVIRKKRTDVYTIRIKSLFLFSFLASPIPVATNLQDPI